MRSSWKLWIPNRCLGAAILLAAGTWTAFYAASRFNSPLFRSLAEFCAAIVACAALMIFCRLIHKAFRAVGLTQPANVVLKNLQQNEETLRRQQAELQRLYTVAQAATEAKSNFLANMSHEIRTPMTAILGFTDVLAGNLAGSGQEESREAVAIIKKNGEYLLTLLNDILDLSKIEAGKLDVQRVPCSPCQLVADVASLMRVRAEAKGLGLNVEFSGPMPETIVTDPVRLRQILVNLVGNAVKFTEVGEVRLKAGMAADDGNQQTLRIDVIDTGIGLPTEQIDRLFQPFSQADAGTNRKVGGTGLGLAISKRLANILGGDILARSAPGEGSTFSLLIAAGSMREVRMVEQPAEAVSRSRREAEQPCLPQVRLACRILLAEDGPDNKRLLTFLLKKAGARVTVVDNGQAAMEHALATFPGWGRRYDDPAEPFDVILMDMQMPIMDGYEATRRIREGGYRGPIIALTAHAMVEDRQKCLDAGCDDYLSKPIEREKLVHLIARHTGLAAATAS